MKLKITEKGCDGLTVGQIVEVDGGIPAGLLNKCIVVDGASPAPKTLIVNPAPVEHDGKDDLVIQAEELGIEVDKRWGAKRIQEEIDAKLAE